MSDVLAQPLQRRWWRPRLTLLTALLSPLGWLVGAEAARRRAAAADPRKAAAPLSVPVGVVGNVIVGGARQTPTVIALVELLRRQGRTPGIVSRGHGRSAADVQLLDAASAPTADP